MGLTKQERYSKDQMVNNRQLYRIETFWNRTNDVSCDIGLGKNMKILRQLCRERIYSNMGSEDMYPYFFYFYYDNYILIS